MKNFFTGENLFFRAKNLSVSIKALLSVLCLLLLCIPSIISEQKVVYLHIQLYFYGFQISVSRLFEAYLEPDQGSHGLQIPSESINQRNLKIWAYAQSVPKNLGLGLDFWPCDFLTGRPQSVSAADAAHSANFDEKVHKPQSQLTSEKPGYSVQLLLKSYEFE